MRVVPGGTSCRPDWSTARPCGSSVASTSMTTPASCSVSTTYARRAGSARSPWPLMSPAAAVGLAGHAQIGGRERLETGVADGLVALGAVLPSPVLGALERLVDDLEEQLLLGDAGPDAVALEARQVALGAAL